MEKTKEWTYKLISKKALLIYWLIVFGACLIFSYVYYEIQCGVNQSHEELGALMYTYARMNFGVPLVGIMDLVYIIVFHILGFTYMTQRIVYAVVFFMISFFTLDLCLRNDKNEINLGCIPIYILFMVFLHLSGNHLSKFFGDASNGEGYYLQYPFSLHMEATFCSVGALWCLNFFPKRKLQLNKYVEILCDIIIIFFFFIINRFDFLLYMIYLVFPYIIFRLRFFLAKRKNLNRAFLGIFVLFFILYNGVNRGLITISRVHSIKGIYEIRDQVSYFIICFLELFNIDIKEGDIIITDNIVFVIRAMFLFFMIYVIVRAVLKFFDEKEKTEFLDTIISFGFIFFFLAFVFTDLGYFDRVRYLNCMLPFGTILICRNGSLLLQKMKLHSYSYLYALCIVTMVLSLRADWNVHKGYDIDQIRLAKLVEDNNLHSGVGILNVANKLTATTEGKHMTFPIRYNEGTGELSYYIKELQNNEDFIDYIVFDRNRMYVSDIVSEELMIDKYGNPDRIVRYNNYSLMIYPDGLSIQEPNKTDKQQIQIEDFHFFDLNMLGYSEDVESTKDGLIIRNGGYQYGPYAALEAGTYLVKYKGDMLDLANMKCYASLNGEPVYYEMDIQCSKSDEIVYKIILPDDVEAFEAYLINNSVEDIIITSFEIVKIDEVSELS